MPFEPHGKPLANNPGQPAVVNRQIAAPMTATVRHADPEPAFRQVVEIRNGAHHDPPMRQEFPRFRQQTSPLRLKLPLPLATVAHKPSSMRRFGLRQSRRPDSRTSRQPDTPGRLAAGAHALRAGRSGCPEGRRSGPVGFRRPRNRTRRRTRPDPAEFADTPSPCRHLRSPTGLRGT